MKYLIMILMLFIQINICYSQYRQEWVRLEGQNNSAFGSRVRLDRNNNIYAAGNYFYNLGKSGIYLLKYDVNGNKLWERKYGDSLYLVRDMGIDKNGNILIAATYNYHCLTLKYDSTGNLIWSRGFYTEIQSDVASLKIDKNNNVYVGGTAIMDNINYYTKFFLVKYDTAGNLIWNRDYIGDGHDNHLGAMAIDKNDNIFLTGSCTYLYQYGKMTTLKYSSDGNLIWEKRYSSGIGTISKAIYIDTLNYIIVSGSSTIGNSIIISTVKYENISGSIIWSMNFKSDTNACIEYPVNLAGDNKNNIYLITSHQTNEGDGNYLTMKYNSNGEILWVRKYINSIIGPNRPAALCVDKYSNVFITGTVCRNYSNFFSIFYDSVGNIIDTFKFCGNIFPTSDRANDITIDSNSNVYVIGAGDYDAQGNDKLVLIKYSKTTGIENNSVEIPENYFLSQNYPNPFNSTTRFEFKIPIRSYISIGIFDILGKEIKVISKGFLNSGFYSYYYDASELPSGIYFYRLQSNKFTDTKKMVIIK